MLNLNLPECFFKDKKQSGKNNKNIKNYKNVNKKSQKTTSLFLIKKLLQLFNYYTIIQNKCKKKMTKNALILLFFGIFKQKIKNSFIKFLRIHPCNGMVTLDKTKPGIRNKLRKLLCVAFFNQVSCSCDNKCFCLY